MVGNWWVRASSIAVGKRCLARAGLLLLGASALTACVPEPDGFTTEVVNSEDAVSSKTSTLLRVAEATKTNGDGADASALYQKVVQEHPEVAKARTSLAQSLLDKGDPTLALRYFNEAKKLDPNNVENMIGAGQARMARHEPLQAQKEFRAALQLDPANVLALNGLGVALDAVEKHEQAQKHYQKALALEPGNQAVRNNYGLSLALSGKHDQAVAELAPLAKEQGEVGKKARQNLALSFAMRGDFVTASKWAQVDLKPDDIRNDLKVYGSTAPE